MSTNASEDPVWNRRWDCRHKAWVQVRYHRARQRWWDLVDKLTKAATALLGAFLFGPLLQQHLPYVATAVAGLSLLSLVFQYTDRKQIHKELAEQAAALVAEIEAVQVDQLTADHTGKWASEYMRLCAKAPPPLKTLTILCECEQSQADGNPDQIPVPSWAARLLRHVL